MAKLWGYKSALLVFAWAFAELIDQETSRTRWSTCICPRRTADSAAAAAGSVAPSVHAHDLHFSIATADCDAVSVMV